MAEKLAIEQNKVVIPSNLERVLMKVKSEGLVGRLSGWNNDWINWDYWVNENPDDWENDDFWTNVWYTDYGNSNSESLYRPSKVNSTYETISEAFRLLYK